jgi:hypothetical protein
MREDLHMPEDKVLARLTSICLALPEAVANDQHPPHRCFVVANKNFAWYTVNEHGSDRIALGVRADGKDNEALVASDPERFELPKYMARHGWVNYFLDVRGRRVDWAEVDELVRDSYLIQAPRRLARLVTD